MPTAAAPADTPALNAVVAELAALDDPRMRAVNQRHGDDHGVNLTGLRALAKRLKTRHDLALELWDTGNTDARLLALLICRPRAFTPGQLDAMLRQIAAPKLLDWFVTHAVKPGPHAEPLRQAWKDDPAEYVAAAGWALTVARVVKQPEGLDLDALLDEIEAGLKTAPARKQWSMNHCLAEIGIHSPPHRARALAIGETLQVLADYPTSPGCTSPYAPAWIGEMVRRREG